MALTAPTVWAAPGERASEEPTSRSRDLGQRRDGVELWSDLRLDLSYRLPARPRTLQEPIDLRLPALGCDTLALSCELLPAWRVYVSADLDAGLPRLDAVDGDTYFTVGSAVALTSHLSVFVEDFQPASMILGDDEAEPAPSYSWDGHQVAVGLRSRLGRFQLEACALLYALSVSGRRDGVGCVGSLTVGF